MCNKLSLASSSVLVFLSFATLCAQESWTKEQLQILEVMERLSASTAPDGAGAEEYASVLAEDFSRWTIGSPKINDKQAWVDGVKQWFNDGWRVLDRKVSNLEILVKDDFAFTRRIVEETYQGPDKENSVSKAALAEIWVQEENQWLLLRVNAHPMDSN